MALLALNTFGTLQRDAPPVRLPHNYPEPAANASEESIGAVEYPKTMSAALVEAAKKSLGWGCLVYLGGKYDRSKGVDESQQMKFSFDVLVTALPLSGEEAQLERIAKLQEENKAVGLELQKQLEAAEKELKQVQELFNQAAENCLNLKKTE